MSKPSFAHLLLGLGALQIAVLATVGPPDKSEAFTWNQAVNWAQNRHLAEGSMLPRFAARADQRQAKITFPATVVFRGTCSCEDLVVQSWMATARTEKENGVLVCVGSGLTSGDARRLVGFSQPILWSNSTEVSDFLSAKELPVAVHVNGQGVITSIQSQQ